jgi:Core-2/I-Branching enzyme
MRAIDDPRNSCVVHIDKRSGPQFAQDIQSVLRAYPHVQVIPSQRALWGGYSLVDAELRGMERLLSMGSQWRHFINLSGQDFPLKSQQFIRDFFADHPQHEFIRANDQRATRPDTLNRIEQVFVEGEDAVAQTGVRRDYLDHATPYIGTQWKAVTRRFCQFVTQDARAQRFKDFYRNSFIADEAFFQTVMMNTGNHGPLVNDDLRTIDWVPDGPIKLRPRTFDATDVPMLKASANLFARKFDHALHPRVLDLMDAHLLSTAARRYVQRHPHAAPQTVAMEPAMAA